MHPAAPGADNTDGASPAPGRGEAGYAPRIEGGLDAIVVGATVDGFVAAWHLAKAGLKTVLLEAGAASPVRREFAPGYFSDDGEILVRTLDPAVIADLDLYRHGLSFVQRRFETVYYFPDGSALRLDGDLYQAFEALYDFDEEEADIFQAFTEEILEAGRDLRPFLKGEGAVKLSKRSEAFLNKYASASLDQVVSARFKNDYIKSLLLAEASLQSGLRPSDPHSFLALVRRWAGEAVGLQAGAALPAGGYGGVFDALRRAAQAAGVEFRAGADINAVIVEWDKAAGVAMADGSQVRAPVVVHALNSKTAFMNHVGPQLTDIEFQRVLSARATKAAAAKVHFALKGTPRDGKTRLNLTRRLVYCPDALALRKAYRMARDGEASSELLMELVFPSVYEEGWAPPNGNLAAGWLHPVPFEAESSVAMRGQVRAAAIKTLERIAPGAQERLEAVEVRLADDLAQSSGLAPSTFSGARGVFDAVTLARAATGASGVDGVFFCGPEAQIGPGVNGAAGRNAGRAAVRYARRDVARNE